MIFPESKESQIDRLQKQVRAMDDLARALRLLSAVVRASDAAIAANERWHLTPKRGAAYDAWKEARNKLQKEFTL